MNAERARWKNTGSSVTSAEGYGQRHTQSVVNNNTHKSQS